MFTTRILCFALLIAATKIVSGEILEEQIEYQKSPLVIVNKLKTWMTSKIHELNNEVMASENELMDRYHRLVSESETQISDEISRMKTVFQPLELISSGRCVKDASSDLDLIKTVSISNFRVCANLTDIFLDIKSAVSQSASLGTLMLNSLKKWLNGLNGCLNKFNEKSIKCVIKYAFTIYDTFKNIIHACEAYGKNIKRLNKKIADEIHACLHPTNGIKVNDQVEKVMGKFKSCSKINSIY